MAKLQFNKCFKAVNNSRHRYRVIMGGAGSGKSVNVAQDYIVKLMNPKFVGSNLLVVRKVEQSNKNSTYSELCRGITSICGNMANEIWEIKEASLELRCKVTGCRIIFCGFNDARQREKVKSINFPQGKLTWIWIEEATEICESDLDILDDRLRGLLPENLYYQITLTFNPVSNRHWIKRRFFDNPSSMAITHHSTYLDNKFIDSDYAKRMELRRKFDPEGYRVYALGEWGNHSGLILTNYEVHKFEIDFDSIVYGQDFGYNHANAIVGVGFRDDEIYIFSEIYQCEKDTSELISIADGKVDKKRLMICDCAEPDRVKMWRKAGYNAIPCKKGAGSVAAQIDYLKQHKIHILPCCSNIIAELGEWSWLSDKNGNLLDVPRDDFDDAIAALRYAISNRIVGSGVTFLQ